MLTLLLALAFKYGRSSEDMGIKLVNTVKPYVPLERYQISDKLHNEYGEAITELSISFHGAAVDKVNTLIKQAKEEEWHKEELASRLREVMKAQRWRVERLARTETHRARGLGQVDAMVSLQNKAQVRITKTWQTVSDKPCEFCLEMAGRTVNVADSYLKTGEAVSGVGSNLFINDYKNIDTSLLHPNCTCIERFKVTENYINSSSNSLAVNQSLSNTLSREQLIEMHNVLNSMPEEHKKAWKRYTRDIIVNKASKKGGQFYRPSENCVYLNYVEVFKGISFGDKTYKKPFDTFLHEYGHGIDFNSASKGYSSRVILLFNGKTLGGTILDEARAKFNNINAKTDKVKENLLSNEILAELQKKYKHSDLNCIVDLYGGAVFKNGYDHFGGWGHPASYWKRPRVRYIQWTEKEQEEYKAYVLGAEGFAEMFSASARNDKEQIELFEKYLPESYNMFKELLERIVR